MTETAAADATPTPETDAAAPTPDAEAFEKLENASEILVDLGYLNAAESVNEATDYFESVTRRLAESEAELAIESANGKHWQKVYRTWAETDATRRALLTVEEELSALKAQLARAGAELPPRAKEFDHDGYICESGVKPVFVPVIDYDALRTAATLLVAKNAVKPLTYLAAPYSHPDESVRISRFEKINAAAAILMQHGKLVYSPISHTHPIAMAGSLPLGWEFWQKYDTAFIEHSKEIIVLMLDGWQESKGVTAEIAIAECLHIPITYASDAALDSSRKGGGA